MKQAEHKALLQDISNDARVLYLLGLRPHADARDGKTPAINYKQLLQLLNSGQTNYARGREINSLIEELQRVGLVQVPQTLSSEQSLNGHPLTLPLLAESRSQYDELHLDWAPMQLSWQPHGALFEDLLQLVGLIEGEYTQDELGEFIAYWMGRPQSQHSQFQWTQKFVFHLKQKRLASGVKVVQKVGNQLVKPKAGIEADDNARKLVEKYNRSK